MIRALVDFALNNKFVVMAIAVLLLALDRLPLPAMDAEYLPRGRQPETHMVGLKIECSLWAATVRLAAHQRQQSIRSVSESDFNRSHVD